MFTALVTPFNSEGKLDHDGLKILIERQKGHADGLLVLGTTAEAATLSNREKKEIISFAKELAPELHIMAGCGSNSTTQTIENIQKAADLGVHSALVIAPYYNKPTQEGIFRHFEAISKACSLPLLAYNNPSRACVNIEVKTLQRISQLPTVIGVKETSGSIPQLSEILHDIKKANPDFVVFSGDDVLAFPSLALGVDGIISGGANLIPKGLSEMVRAFKKGDIASAREIHYRFTPLFKALLSETHPIPLKAALQLMGLPAGEPRLPLTPLNPSLIPSLQEVLSW